MKLSVSQINKMKHALGLDRSKLSYRNYYNSGMNKIEELDELVSMGLMTVRNVDICVSDYYYFVTDEGIKVMKEITGDFEVKHD